MAKTKTLKMRISLVGCTDNIADKLVLVQELLRESVKPDAYGDHPADTLDADIFTLRELSKHAAMVEKDPSLLEQFADLYCLVKKEDPNA